MGWEGIGGAHLLVLIHFRPRSCLLLLCLHFTWFLLWLHVAHSCRISEFFCDNGICTGLDRFCDGNDDCGDKSDEPRQCTRCNRTYYGDRHKTYTIDIKPKQDKLPFFCGLTFIAGGGELGDIVELSFERFNLGKLDSHFRDGCPYAYMQIIENNRSLSSAGAWCGDGIKWNVYYSETSNVTLILVANHEMNSSTVPFDFRVNYRFLSRMDAVTRYGIPNSMHHRGELIPGTVCDRSYHDCDSQVCRVQSPNFPGIYPRNVTCFYHITQITVPEGQHAMIVVSQRNEEKLKVKTSQAPHEKYGGSFGFQRSGLWYGSECQNDYVNIYDGATVDDPLWLKFCRSGPLPEVISSGPEMLLEFHSMPFDHPELHSFELNVDVRFVPEKSLGTRMHEHKCDWRVTSDQSPEGALFSLQHSAPAGTKCSYHLQGHDDEIIWLYFVYFYAETRRDSQTEDQHVIRIELYNGVPDQTSTFVTSSSNGTVQNDAILLDTSSGEKVPRLCAHARNYPEYIPVRPCKVPEESYVSTGPELFLRYGILEGARLDFVRFIARYEFVNTFQSGHSINGTDCDRVIHSTLGHKKGPVSSPQNLFLFGRGGKQNLTCTFTFVARPRERVRLILKRMRTGRGHCTNEYHTDTRRYTCIHHDEDATSELRITQFLWYNTAMPLACICRVDNLIEIETVSSHVQLTYSVTGMSPREDASDYEFEAVYEFVTYSDCNSFHYLSGIGGDIHMHANPRERAWRYLPKCPWFIEASSDKYIYIQVPGDTKLDNCPTSNRIAVFTPGEIEPMTLICPSQLEGESVDVFSKSWNKSTKSIKSGGTNQMTSVNANNNNLILELIANQVGSYTATWLKLSKTKQPGQKAAFHEECLTVCPELENACISPRLWCDGKPHCPSGNDEAAENCLQQHFPWLYVGAGAGCGALIIIVFVAALAHRKKEAAAKKGQPIPTDEFPMDGKESEC